MICDGEILKAVQEERFTRKKHDSQFPVNAINYCLKSQNISLKDIKAVVYYEKPLLTFERLLETYLGSAPRGSRSFIASMQVWLKEKLFLKSELKNKLIDLQKKIVLNEVPVIPKLLFSEHHMSHAAAAFYPSPFEESIILCMDGVGEWATTSAWIGKGSSIKPIWEISFPHSIGLLYSAFTYYCGFKVNSGEYKLMGLAPYGNPIYVNLIKENLIDLKEDGSYKLDVSFFKFHRGFRMTSSKFDKLFCSKPRKRESKLTQFHMDLAASIQKVTEEIILKIAKSLSKDSGIKNICLSGGVALNCVANGKLLEEKIFDNVWIQPASGDAGSALGAALYSWYNFFNKSRKVNLNDSMKGTYLGCEFSNEFIIDYLNKINAPFENAEDKILFKKIAKYLEEGKVIGWFNGPMEFGPRALGARSILGDPRNQNMQKIMNLKIKYRESFRPFAPSILEEDLKDYFSLSEISPYMLLVSQINKKFQKLATNEADDLFGIDKLNIIRSDFPAITHVDYSARIQTVSYRTNPRFYNLIKAFKEKTGCPMVVNTSFNVRGEPIVSSPKDAYQCFMRTEMDILILQNQILFKEEQPINNKINNWENEFELD